MGTRACDGTTQCTCVHIGPGMYIHCMYALIGVVHVARLCSCVCACVQLVSTSTTTMDLLDKPQLCADQLHVIFSSGWYMHNRIGTQWDYRRGAILH